MKKTFRILLALTLALVLPLTALAQSNFGRYDEPITISVMGTDKGVVPYDANDPERKSASDNAYIHGYLEYMNIKVERIVPEDGTALNALLNTGMASGDLPDIMEVGREMFFTLAENGVLQDLRPAYDKYAEKDLIKYVVETFPDRMATGNYDGQWLALPTGQLFSDGHMLWIRQDWLDQVQMEIPKTIDELIEVARVFKEKKLGGEKTVPFGVTGYTGSPIFGDIASFAAGYGVVMGTWDVKEDGSYFYADTDPRMKDVLLRLQSMYKEGLIKSDFAVSNILTEEVSNGNCGMFCGPEWYGVTCIQTSINSDEKAVWTCVPLPSLTGETVTQWTNALPSNFFVVNAECEHPEALFMLAEFGMKMRYDGTPEESKRFNICEDNYQMHNLNVTRQMIRPDEGLAKLEIIQAGLDANADTVSEMANTDYQNIKAAVNGDRAHEGRRLTWLVARNYIYNLGVQQPEKLKIAYPGPQTETMSLYQESINAALASAMMKVIMGEDISVYEKAVEAWYKSGGQTITDEVNAYYAGAK